MNMRKRGNSIHANDYDYLDDDLDDENQNKQQNQNVNIMNQKSNRNQFQVNAADNGSVIMQSGNSLVMKTPNVLHWPKDADDKVVDGQQKLGGRLIGQGDNNYKALPPVRRLLAEKMMRGKMNVVVKRGVQPAGLEV